MLKYESPYFRGYRPYHRTQGSMYANEVLKAVYARLLRIAAGCLVTLVLSSLVVKDVGFGDRYSLFYQLYIFFRGRIVAEDEVGNR